MLNVTNQFLPGRAAGVMVDILHSPRPLCPLRGEKKRVGVRWRNSLCALTPLIQALNTSDLTLRVLPLLSSLSSCSSRPVLRAYISAPRDRCQTRLNAHGSARFVTVRRPDTRTIPVCVPAIYTAMYACARAREELCECLM